VLPRQSKRRADGFRLGRRKKYEMIGVNVARKGTWIKTLPVAFALGTFAQGAVAAELNCRTIESTGGRLACYDAAFPPKVKKPATTSDDASRPAYNDPLIAEDTRIAAKLKNVCRGC
jgi:hypothetical protein